MIREMIPPKVDRTNDYRMVVTQPEKEGSKQADTNKWGSSNKMWPCSLSIREAWYPDQQM